MSLWEKLQTTDPKYTKAIQGKGFSGTSINPTYINKKLTEVFGPCGTGWGIETIKEQFVEGAWLDEKTREIVHVLHVKLWYGKESIFVEGTGTTVFIGKNRNGIFTDDEFYKKTKTDAITNAAKMLGASADIFMGLYDDNKYIAEIKKQFEPKLLPKRADVNTALAKCNSVEEISKLEAGFIKKYGSDIMEQLSGHPTKQGETFTHLFSTHRDRVNGVSPLKGDFIARLNKVSDEQDFYLMQDEYINTPNLHCQEIDEIFQQLKDGFGIIDGE